MSSCGKIELFFKWIKQHLRIKSFFGTSENAVKTQVWIAVSAYVLVAIVKKWLNLTASLYEILQFAMRARRPRCRETPCRDGSPSRARFRPFH